jgi:hypothetical protein
VRVNRSPDIMVGGLDFSVNCVSTRDLLRTPRGGSSQDATGSRNWRSWTKLLRLGWSDGESLKPLCQPPGGADVAGG